MCKHCSELGEMEGLSLVSVDLSSSTDLNDVLDSLQSNICGDDESC